MIVYHASKKGFINDVFNSTIADDMTMLSCPIWEITTTDTTSYYHNTIMHCKHNVLST